MDRISTSTKAVDLYGPGKHGFKNGNLSLGITPTDFNAEWCNGLQEEVLAVIEGAGLAPDAGTLNQLQQAIQLMIAAATAQDFKSSVRVASTANIANLAGGAPDTLDGIALVLNDRILVKDQATAAQNGIYVVTTLGTGADGTWTRAADADGVGELTSGAIVAVEEGATWADTIWMLTTDGPITVGTTPLAFVRKDNQGFPTGYIRGLTLSNNGANPTTRIDFSTGCARDAADGFDMVLSAPMTKTLQAAGAWAAGSNQNGLFSGAKANNTWYHCFLIRKADGSIDAGFDTSITAVNIPAGYTAYRRLGSVKTDSGGNIIGFVQMRDEFWWNAAILDIASTTIGTAATNYAISVPPGVSVVADLMLYGGGNGSVDSNLLVRSPLGSDVAPAPGSSTPSSAPATIANIQGLGGDVGSGTHARMLTNTSSQITTRSATSNAQLYCWTRGWRDQI